MTQTLQTTLRVAAIEAGRAIMNVYQRNDMHISIKSDGSPVTLADQEADRIIAAHLDETYPDILRISEENLTGTMPQKNEPFFLIDPLDGTKEFINRNGDFTVNIALIRSGIPVAGVVFAPVHRDLYITDDLGNVAFHEKLAPNWIDHDALPNYRPITCRDVGTALTALTSRSHLDPMTHKYLQQYPIASTTAHGSSLKLCVLAAGEADIYPRLGPTSAWDTGAGDAVLRAAGGTIVDAHHLKPLHYEGAQWRNPWFVAASKSLNILPFTM